MEFKNVLNKIYDVVFLFTLVVILFKMNMSTLTLGDGLSVFLILSVTLAARVVDYKYPRRPDLFKEIEEINSLNKNLKDRIETIEAEMSGVKLAIKTKY